MAKQDRDINKLAEPFQTKVKLWLEMVGKTVFVTEATRTKERQQELFNQGRTTKWKIVTMTLKSKHVDKIAIDFWFSGKILYPAIADPKWKYVTDLWKAFGMSRGWDWDKFKDFPHFEDNGKSLDQQIKINSDLYNKTTDGLLQNALHIANDKIKAYLLAKK